MTDKEYLRYWLNVWKDAHGRAKQLAEAKEDLLKECLVLLEQETSKACIQTCGTFHGSDCRALKKCLAKMKLAVSCKPDTPSKRKNKNGRIHK
jgi:hypothetical protein